MPLPFRDNGQRGQFSAAIRVGFDLPYAHDLPSHLRNQKMRPFQVERVNPCCADDGADRGLVGPNGGPNAGRVESRARAQETTFLAAFTKRLIV